MGLFDRLRGTDDPRVAFLGIDGVPYDLVAENPETFPNLTEIAAAGSAGAIDSIVPPESSACWPALTTGANPGETGVYGFQDRETGSYDTYVPMGRDVQRERVWDRVTDEGRNASVFNVPVTFPPQRNVQRMVSGFLSPGVDKAAHPEELRKRLDESGYRIDVNAKLGHRDDKADFLEHAHTTLDRRQEAFRHYIEADDWDLFFGVYMTTDRVNHFLWEDYATGGRYREEFLAFYSRLDECIGEIREELPQDATLVVAADHGFTTLDYEVHCNEWLEREGWLSYADDDHAELSDIDDDTRAYAFVPGRFYVNLEGREPRGSVPESEYEDVRAELRADLKALEGPNGRPVVNRVVEKETAFRGDHDAIAPDLVAIPNDGFDLKAGFKGSHDAVFDDSGPRNGMHTFDGPALFVDEPGIPIDDADLLDVAPTILELMDIDFERTAFDGASLLP
ncbi:alkaline phosphatase family protein [Haloparvum sedimenti]|uniref:alkaline phosphatase family protein n=1 Tax=Haloparvum sedimenti TaxID=1678448 RepID=UPI00071E9DAB|nr:alkaline phosphatase family protein [Haloparvum sedimenti]